MDSNQQSSCNRSRLRRRSGVDEHKCPVVECHLEIDVILESSDGVQYGTHTKNIEAFTGTFPPSEACNPNGPPDVVSLPESSDVVSLLLQYMHNQRHPDPIEFEFDVLSRLADAAERYMVFSAIEMCKIRMKEAMSNYPLPVLKYAVIHHYPELSDLAAPKTVSLSLDDMRESLQDEPNILFAWIQYREFWLKVLLSTFAESQFYCGCQNWECLQLYHAVLSFIGRDLGMIWDVCSFIDNQSKVRYCWYHQSGHGVWKVPLSRGIAALPKFSSVLSSKLDNKSASSYLANFISFVIDSIKMLVFQARIPAELSGCPACPVAGCRLEVDIIIKSSDSVRFGSHVKNLETYSDALPPSEFRDTNTQLMEVVSLCESSDVILLLLQYMHNQRQPDSSEIKFDVLSRLAEAAEKYMVFSAIQVCKIHMKAAILDHPFPVLQYAAIHNYPDLSNLAAPLTISLSLDEVKKNLHDKPNVLFAWLQYRECWLKILLSTFDGPMATVCPHTHCQRWLKLFQSLLVRIGQDLGAMRDVDMVVGSQVSALSTHCSSCFAGARSWRVLVRQQIAALPTFSSFL